MPIPNFRYYIDEIIRSNVDIDDDDGKPYRTLQTLRVAGWAFGAQPILEITALVDGVSCSLGSATMVPRDDVMNAFPEEPHARHSGFRVSLSLRDAERHTVKLKFFTATSDHHVDLTLFTEQAADINVLRDFIISHQCADEQYIETSCDPESLKLLLRRVEGTFESCGEADPFWSVLTDERFRKATIANHLDEFYATGHDSLKYFTAALRRNGIATANIHSLLEIGCGVGRVTVHLADLFDRVIGLDISRPHLTIAQQLSDRRGKTNIRYEHMSSLSIIDHQPMCDAVFTVIVLQHNPPPVIGFMLDRLLKRVRPGGVAYFQVPVLSPGYSYTTKQHLSQKAVGIEQHVLPQHEVFRLLSENGFDLVEVLPDAWLEPPHLSYSFLARRRGYRTNE